LTPISSTTGTGSGSVRFSVATNTNTNAGRSGSVTVAGQSVSVNHAAATICDAVVSPLALTVSGGGSARPHDHNAQWLFVNRDEPGFMDYAVRLIGPSARRSLLRSLATAARLGQ
jgi:hypothetical protein